MYVSFFKRILDFTFALIALIILFVPLVFVTMVTWIDLKGNPIFLQMRSGKNRKPFRMFKFRSMPFSTPVDVPSNLIGDIQLSRWQSFIRRTSIDELPQLVNILLGDMSVVGPRPVICEEQDLIDERDRYGANNVLPGLTGWAQVNGRDKLGFQEKAKLDGYYATNMSFLFDLKCIWLTANKVIIQEGVMH